MATLLNVVVNKEAFYPYACAEEIHEYLINDALDAAFPGKFDSYSSWDDSTASCVIDGATHPAVLKNECKDWEKKMASALAKKIRNLIAEAADKNMSLEDYLPQAVGLTDLASLANGLSDYFDYPDEVYMDADAIFLTSC